MKTKAPRIPDRAGLIRALEALRHAALQASLGGPRTGTAALTKRLEREMLAAARLGAALGGEAATRASARAASRGLREALPLILESLLEDARAAWERDPAAKSVAEVILCYPGFEAVAVYRLANALDRLGVPLLPRMLTEMAHSRTGADIHPSASIGRSFFIDHGTGTVIGETATIGDGVTLYHGVTLGVRGFERDAAGRLVRGAKRHPTLEDGVTVYAHASIFGGDVVIGRNSVIGAYARVDVSVPAHSKVALRPSSIPS